MKMNACALGFLDYLFQILRNASKTYLALERINLIIYLAVCCRSLGLMVEEGE